MRDRRRNGFTLVELTVVLVIMAIILAIATPFFIKYWRAAEFRKNESHARTVYLAAESKLTWYRTSGQWESFKKEILSSGEKSQGLDESVKDRNIYAVTLGSNVYGTAQAEGNPVLKLLDDSSYDKENLSAAIAIEIDIDTGEVYSAFYGTKCKGLTYEESDSDGRLTMVNRDYESRRKRLLGYYSAEDTVNVVELEPVRLRIMTISLLNSEKLSLNWSSNVGASQAVSYEIGFYKKDGDTKLFSLTMSPYDMSTSGWNGSSGSSSELAAMTLKDASGAEKGSWYFPVTYSDNKYSLVLDAMMSAKVMAALDAVENTNERTELEKTSSTSICRLSAVAGDLSVPQTIYATVKATSYTGTASSAALGSDEYKEYRDSEEVSSNTANTMYGDNTNGTDVRISTFRHLSNIRYYETNPIGTTSTTFTLEAGNMDWTAVGTGLYDAEISDAGKAAGTDARANLSWQESSVNQLDFPSIPELAYGQTLTGKGSRTQITNLRLGSTSVISDAIAEKTTKKHSAYLGLFCEITGSVKNMTLKDPVLNLTADENTAFTSLKGIGILTGRFGGYGGTSAQHSEMSDVTISVSTSNTDPTVLVDLSGQKKDASNPAVGGVAGVLAGKIMTTGVETQFYGSVQNVTVEGTVQVTSAAVTAREMPTSDTSGNQTESKIGKITATGGIVGYAWLNNAGNKSNGQLRNCVNHASVTSNLLAGGVVGYVTGAYNSQSTGWTEDNYKTKADLLNCSNDGLILSSTVADVQTLQGHYIGGITGYAENAIIYAATSASGRASGFTYSSADKELLKGTYVGGIVGFGDQSVIYGCSTEKNGYVLGSDYVGGIAGGLGSDLSDAIRAGSVAVTTNGNYVIGNNYVGGITGINENKVTLKNCVNNGIAACYEAYAGGIVGYNSIGATIYDCASYLSDYSSSIFNMIVQTWQTKGDYAGGIAGYNDGAITFTAESEAITVKSVSSIVVGNDYVGGIAGFNDVHGTLDVHYTLIGGRVYGYGDAVGGCFGLNASAKVLSQELVVKPRSVEGQYYVGGIIGANVVNLSGNTTMDQYRAENSLGSISGKAFVGGLVGYQRTYREEQISAAKDGTIRKSLTRNLKNNSDSDRLLPNLDDDNVPTEVAASTNTFTLTITTKDNSTDSFQTAANNVPIEANAYAGGIVGYCEKDSALLIKNCWNKGELSYASGKSASGVNLEKFITSNEVKQSNVPSDASKISLSFAGGIIGVNLENQIIDHCSNTGTMSGFAGIGGMVGLNAGLIYHCSLDDNFGNAGLDYVGGMASVNVQSSDNKEKTYKQDNNTEITYTTGTIMNCSTAQNKTLSGKGTVGGITAWNMTGGVLKENSSLANITGTKDDVGGVAGCNSGDIELKDESDNSPTRTIRSTGGTGVGGIVGCNEAGGTLKISGLNSDTELVAVGTGVTVTGYEKVGGIAGINEGSLGNTGSSRLVSSAKLVHASHGYAGGVVGTTSGNLNNAANRSEEVRADEGCAGGITALNDSGKSISNCVNYGNVSSSNGHAGGIAAENRGTVTNCTVQSASEHKTVTIYSRGVDETGAVCAVNTGTIEESKAVSGIKLQSSATVFGGIVGTNQTGATVKNTKLTYMPTISSSGGSSLTVGGAVGQNEGTIDRVTTSGIAFENFTNYQYLGGIAGTNGLTATGENGAKITDCTFSGTIQETSGAAGNCYGGIAGINAAKLEDCSVGLITMTINGVYTATSTSTTEQKEALATHAGGITGKNDTTGVISGCTLADDANSCLSADNGMLGGVTGFNKGSIELSGSQITASVMTDKVVNETGKTARLEALASSAAAQGLEKDDTYITWPDTTSEKIENLQYSDKKKVTAGRMQFYMNTNGNLGGITAYNAASGQVTRCVSGNWFLNNKSEAIGVGTGGIIGMNESEKDLRFLVNGAFVGRQIKNPTTNRFAGGIIGNQNNTTGNEWTISDSVNYGTVYCYNSHYSGGIMGQWTGMGGTVENCRNYGNLQTTYRTSWVGASGGIVAQLYHGMRDEVYNIISCSNYGSIYTQSGKATSGGANDSAGILGNITTYYVSGADQAIPFTVQILDCANAPGVEIYSASMASGIFGFLSTDDADRDRIRTSTAKVEIRIERCRNFANKLQGASYSSGIFGDRYGIDAWKNYTIVRDNFSVQGTRHYSQEYYPIYASGAGEGNSSDMTPENRKNNYAMAVFDSWFYVPNNNYGELRIAHKGDYASGSGQATNGWNNDEGLNKRYALYSRIMYNITKGKYAVITMNGIVYGFSSYIDTDGRTIRNNEGSEVGEILYYLEDSNMTDQGEYITTEPTNIVYVNARGSWERIEGITTSSDNKKQIAQPTSASAKIVDGKVEMTVTPASNSDPFLYEIEVSDGSQTKTYRIYTEQGQFTLPSDMSGNLTVLVRAVSMYDDVEASEWIKAEADEISTILPDPDVRLEVVSGSNADGNYQNHAYRVSLNNLEAYNRTKSDGSYMYSDWSVTVTVPGTKTGEVTLTREYPEADITMGDVSDISSYSLTAQAASSNTSLKASKKVSTSVALQRYYRAPVALREWTRGFQTEVSVSGETVDDLAITVSLTSPTSLKVDFPPIYRAELIGTWDGHKDVVFAKQDILVASQGTATAVLSGFGDYISSVDDLRVRIWYASSGLGPVYTYHDVDVNDAVKANVWELQDVDAEGTSTYQYTYSLPVAEYNKTNFTMTSINEGQYYYDPYVWQKQNLFTWLPTPILDGTDNVLTPVYGRDGTLTYKFTWDTNTTYGQNASYKVSLVGIDAQNREVVITSDAQVEGNSYTVDGTNWNYTSVRLKVTRIGDTSGNSKTIGRSGTGSYTVKPRLAAPEAPAVKIVDQNELNYQITWSKLADETGCAGYQPYIRVYDSTSGTWGTAEKLTEDLIQVHSSTDGIYTTTVDLEHYAGKRVWIYLVARAAQNGSYLDSLDGVTCEVTVAKRISEPNVTWSVNWSYAPKQSLDAASFRNNGLTVSLTTDNDSIPPGGSSYLLKAYVYDNQSDAKNATAKDPGQYATAYPKADASSKDVDPVEMTATSTTNYTHSLQDMDIAYAGKWIVFYTRISSGSGSVSSQWVKSGSFQLPYVKLEQPDVKQEEVEQTLLANVSTQPNMDAVEKTWTAARTALTWGSVDQADLYELTLEGSVNSDSGTDRIGTTIRIKEKADSITVECQKSGVWMPIANDEDGYHIPDYSVTCTGTYGTNHYTYTLTLDAVLKAEEGKDGSWSYQLLLPDISNVKADDGSSVSNNGFKVTTKAVMKANVQQNLDGSSSDAYVESEEREVTW